MINVLCVTKKKKKKKRIEWKNRKIKNSICCKIKKKRFT